MKKIIGIFSMLFLLAITLGSCTDAPVDEPGQDGLSKTRSAGADATPRCECSTHRNIRYFLFEIKG